MPPPFSYRTFVTLGNSCLGRQQKSWFVPLQQTGLISVTVSIMDYRIN